MAKLKSSVIIYKPKEIDSEIVEGYIKRKRLYF